LIVSMTELWSPSACDTAPAWANGEITSSGTRTPRESGSLSGP
jgi:hypothetical protein